MVARAESIIKLPKGAGPMKCYERHYVLLKGKEAERYLGFSSAIANKGLLIGSYVRPKTLNSSTGKPGIYWERNIERLPKIEDAGCSILRVFYLVGKEMPTQATCSVTWDGRIPDELKSPVTC